MEKLQFSYHAQRRTGHGTQTLPIVREGGYCAYENCELFAHYDRVTAAGYVVKYCRVHYREAHERFDNTD